MLPRRTRRSTSRTAKKPANSLVNPWVSRMISSANQISPVSHRRDVISRVAIFFKNRQVLPKRLGKSRPGRLRLRICRQRAGLGKAESWATGEASREAASPLVELPELMTGSVRQTFRWPKNSPPPIRRWSAKLAAAGAARWRQFPRVDFRLEPDQQFASEIEHGSLDHRGLRQHQG